MQKEVVKHFKWIHEKTTNDKQTHYLREVGGDSARSKSSREASRPGSCLCSPACPALIL